jgi:large subunit ribosomal protein L29
MSADMRKLRETDAAALNAEVTQMREQLFKLRWQALNGQAENPRKIREVRRDIARYRTVLTERARAAKAAAKEQQA